MRDDFLKTVFWGFALVGYDKVDRKILTFTRNHMTLWRQDPYHTPSYYGLYQLAWWFTKDIVSPIHPVLFSPSEVNPIHRYIYNFFFLYFDRSHWLSSFLCCRASPLFFWPFYFSQELNAFSGRYWQSVATVLLSSWISQTDFYFLTKIKFTALNEILLIFFWKDSPLQNFFSLLALICFPQHDNCENPSLSNKPPSHSGLNDHLLYHFR